jgi:acyl-CoA synthetase (NDP forming)
MSADNRHPLDSIFYPASIAVVGASTSVSETGWVKRLIDFGYKGKIYPINPKANEIYGLKAYPRVCDVPYPVDYAILNIPAYFVPQALQDCVNKDIKFVHCYSAGFGENGTDKGKRLEAEIAAIAQKGGVRLLGPNCMGVYCPESGMTFSEDFPKVKGRIALVSQSGAEATRLVFLCQDVNLYFSKVVSYGNAADLDATDFLEYLVQDRDTDIIALYIEGIKNGPAFISAVKKCMENKPVIILKAGLTKNGAKASALHTASMPGSKTVWNTLFKETGAISALTIDEAADIIQGLTRIKNIYGRRVAIVGRGGGIGVIATDICERAGLIVPPFSRETQEKLMQIRPDAGAMFRNPVEPKLGLEGAGEFYLKGLPIIDEDNKTDIILIHMAIDVYGGHTPDLIQNVTDSAYALCAAADSISKPIVAALFTGGHMDTLQATAAARDILTKAGIAVFTGVESAARVINKINKFYRLLNSAM